MKEIVERINRKKNQLRHDIKRLAQMLQTLSGEIDRINEDIEELSNIRTEDIKGENNDEE